MQSEKLFELVKRDPLDELTWLAFADTLEEEGDTVTVSLLRQPQVSPMLHNKVKEHILKSCLPTTPSDAEARVTAVSDSAWRRVCPDRQGLPTSWHVSLTQGSIALWLETRGPFITGVYASQDAWVNQLDHTTLFGLNPITSVRFFCAEPVTIYMKCASMYVQEPDNLTAQYVWGHHPRYRDGYVHREIFNEFLETSFYVLDAAKERACFDTEEEAITALSEAAIKFARRKIHDQRTNASGSQGQPV